VHRRLDRDPDLRMNQLAQRERCCSCSRSAFLIPFAMAHSSGGRLARRAGGWLNIPPSPTGDSGWHVAEVRHARGRSTRAGKVDKRGREEELHLAGSTRIARSWPVDEKVTIQVTTAGGIRLISSHIAGRKYG
jgi:hypothetical protein